MQTGISILRRGQRAWINRRTIATLAAVLPLISVVHTGNAAIAEAAAPSATHIRQALLVKAKTELTQGKWAAAFRDFFTLAKAAPADTWTTQEFIALARQQHRPGRVIRFLANAAAAGALSAATAKQDLQILVGPYSSHRQFDALVKDTLRDRRFAVRSLLSPQTGPSAADEKRRKRLEWCYFLLGRAATDAGRQRAAIGFGVAASQLNAHVPGVNQFVAWQLLQSHDFSGAEAALHQGIHHMSKHLDRYLVQLTIYLADDRTTAALRLAAHYRRMHPHRLLGYWLLARVYHERGQQGKEAGELIAILRYFPDFSLAYRSLLHIAEEKKNAVLVRRLELAYCRQFPGDLHAVIYRADMARHAGKLAKAGQILSAAIALHSGNVSLAMALWHIDNAAHQPAQASRDIARALRYSPDNPQLISACLAGLLAAHEPGRAAAFIKAYALRQLRSETRQSIYVKFLIKRHHLSAAVRWVNNLRRLMPHRRWVMRMRIQLFELQHKQTPAIAMAMELAQAPQPRVRDILALATLEYNRGKLRIYSDLMRKAFRIEPDNALINNDLAYFQAQKRENLPQCLAMAKRAVRAYPDDTASRDTLGWVYYQLGHYHRALREFRLAILLPHGDNAAEFLHVGDTLYKLRHNGSALRSWIHGSELLHKIKRLTPRDRRLLDQLQKRITREKKFQALDHLHNGQAM